MWSIPAAIFFVAFLHRVVPGIVARDLMQAFDASGGIVGFLSAMYFYSYAAFMIPGGLLIDALGARRVVAAGGAVMAAGTLAMAAAAGEGVLFAGRFAVGLGAAVTFTGTLQIAAHWFPPSRFATMSAVTATVGVLGALAGTYPLAALVAAAGWRGAFWILGAATLLLVAACWVVVRDRPRAAAAQAARAPGPAEVLAGMLRVLANPHTWPPFLSFFCWYAAMGNLLLWAVPFLRDVYAFDVTRAALYAMATSLALGVSAPLTGYLSDRVFRRRKLPCTVLTASLFALWLVLVGTLGGLPPWALYALLFAMGLAGGSFVLTWPIGREVNPPALAGIAVAVVNLGGFLGAALTQGPVGAILDARWAGLTVAGARVYPVGAYQAAFGICAVFGLAACLLTLVFRETRGRNIYHEIRQERRAMSDTDIARVRDMVGRAYRAFNARDIEAALATMHPDVAWPNGMEGGYVHGHAGVREYWARQWALIDPRVEPRHIAADPAGRIVVDVHQVVRDRSGALLKDQMVQHVYVVEGGLIRRMEIRPASPG
jgi:MFS family permease